MSVMRHMSAPLQIQSNKRKISERNEHTQQKTEMNEMDAS